MKAVDRMKQFLTDEGFKYKVDSQGDLLFKYQMCTFVYYANDDDQGYFSLALPAIYDEVTELNRIAVLEAAQMMTRRVKVAKAIVVGDHVWLCVESLLDDNPNYEELVPRALGILTLARQEFYQLMEEGR